MEWDLKVPSWDLTELEQNVEPNMISNIISGSSGVLGNQSLEMDCSVDLKLGGLGELGPSNDKWRNDQYRMSKMTTTTVSPSSTSTSKRAKQLNNGSLNSACSVDGCKADLSNCREYHRRHKVCEAHSKTPVVWVGGKEQRFCQQCSRFHSLVEFDEIKRSCRKRLDGHNKRRRKSHPESTNPADFFLSDQGGRILTYPQIYRNPTSENNWTGIVKVEDDGIYGHQQHLHVMNNQTPFAGSFRHGYENDNRFSFMPGGESALTRSTNEASTCQPLKTPSSEERNSRKVFSGELTQVIDSDCVLSLLSSSTQTSSITMGQILPAERIPMGQPLVSTMPYCSLNSYCASQASSSVLPARFPCSIVEEQEGTTMVSDTDANLHCQAVFRVGSEGSSDETYHSLPFSWQ